MEKHLNIVSVLNTIISADARSPHPYVILYTSFGVVRGRAGSSIALLSEQGSELLAGQTLELMDVTLEHYSSHLPTASFVQFYVRLSDILGLAVEN
ncbi:MAG TPA: hypothetical protein VLZ81_06620 [Blastocatellia bacterium]|nr:hypothetical protein [Blastocatellia bacterium]